MICLGTCFQLAEVVRSGPGQPTSARCLEAIKKRWISWAGNPNTVQCDRGLHNRSILAQYMSSQGIQVYHAPLQTPESIGRVEHHGGVLKGMAGKVISQTQARGEVEIQSVLDESCLTKNSLLRNGGYSPSQWVLGKTPREAPSLVSGDQFADLGAIEDQVDLNLVLPSSIRPGLKLRRPLSTWIQVRECNVHYSEVPSQSFKRTCRRRCLF